MSLLQQMLSPFLSTETLFVCFPFTPFVCSCVGVYLLGRLVPDGHQTCFSSLVPVPIRPVASARRTVDVLFSTVVLFYSGMNPGCISCPRCLLQWNVPAAGVDGECCFLSLHVTLAEKCTSAQAFIKAVNVDNALTHTSARLRANCRVDNHS